MSEENGNTPNELIIAQQMSKITQITDQGKMHWQYFYDQPDNMEWSEEEQFQSNTQPLAYMAIDNDYGFGMILIRIPRNYPEGKDVPEIYIQGDKLNAPVSDIQILIDFIKNYMEDLQTGKVIGTYDRIYREVSAATEQHNTQMEYMNVLLTKQAMSNENQMRMMNKMLDVITNSQRITLNQQTQTTTAQSFNTEDYSPTVLNPESMHAVISCLLGITYEEAKLQYSPEMIQSLIVDVHELLDV